MARVDHTELTGAIWRHMRGTASEYDCAVIASAMLNCESPNPDNYDSQGKWIPGSDRIA